MVSTSQNREGGSGRVMMFPWSVAAVFDGKSDWMPGLWHSICYTVWRRKKVSMRFIGSDTLHLRWQIDDVPASPPAGAESPCGLPSPGTACRELEKAKMVRKGQDHSWQKGAVLLEHLPSGPPGLFHGRMDTHARDCQTLQTASCPRRRALDRADQLLKCHRGCGIMGTCRQRG